jgi:hypothetical protein
MTDKVQNNPEPDAASALRPTWGLILAVFDVLEKHGYRRGDDQHIGRAIGLLGDLARIYAGEQEQPGGPPAALRTPPPLTAAQRDTLGQALADALIYRERKGYVKCPDCDVSPTSLCAGHGADFDRIERYTGLARDLGIEVTA